MGIFLPNIRNAARAFIIRDGKVLLLQKISDKQEVYYGLPLSGIILMVLMKLKWVKRQ